MLRFLIGLAAGNAMDAAALGEDEARSVGVPLGALRATLFITAGVLSAASVVLAGPIGFVGLICPHAVRLLAGQSHRTLVLGAAMAGAALVILADTASRAIDLGAGHPPISVLTSLIGGPVLVLVAERLERPQPHPHCLVHGSVAAGQTAGEQGDLPGDAGEIGRRSELVGDVQLDAAIVGGE